MGSHASSAALERGGGSPPPRSRIRTLGQLALSFVVAAAASAQVRRPAPTLSTAVTSPRVAPGSTAHLRLKVALPPGLHVQSDKPRDPALIPTKLSLTPPSGVSILRISYPKATDLVQPGVGAPLAVFSGTFVVDAEIALTRTVDPGALNIPGELRYQSCTDQVCFPPSRAAVSWRLTVHSR